MLKYKKNLYGIFQIDISCNIKYKFYRKTICAKNVNNNLGNNNHQHHIIIWLHSL